MMSNSKKKRKEQKKALLLGKPLCLNPEKQSGPEIKQKVSKMLLAVAEDYIRLGETREKKMSLLRTACTAWNIACCEISKREEMVKSYVLAFQKYNNFT